MAKGRNVLMYATDESYVADPDDMTHNLRELSKTTLGVLWATIDLWENKKNGYIWLRSFLKPQWIWRREPCALRIKEGRTARMRRSRRQARETEITVAS